MKNFLIILFFMISVSFAATGQQRSISGTVKEKLTNDPVQGASVVEKGTNNGKVSGINGEFSLTVSSNAILVVSYIGMETVEVPVGSSARLDILLSSTVEELGDVVVTALGIKRDKKALGYSVQDMKGDEIRESNNNNIVSALSGKIAGAQIITTSGQVGASATIKIRGNKSLDGMSQPLFVVDGTPIMNGSNDARTSIRTDFGNSAMDIDPNIIESVSVLKGPSASALYGSRAADGVILITTKKGNSARKGYSVDISSSVGFDKVGELPYYQNMYGQGYNGDEYNWKTNYPTYTTYQAFQDAREFKWATDGTGRRMDYDESWGTRLDVGLLVDQMEGKQLPWVSKPNNIRDFYETGITNNNNIDLNINTDRATARISLGYSTQTGTMPNTDQDKINLGLNSGFKVSDKFKIDINLNLINLNNDNLPQTGNSMRNPLTEFNSWFGRQVDMKYLKEHYKDIVDYKGTPMAFNWMMDYPTQHQNPYWIAYNNTMSRDRNRTIGNISLTYTIAKGIDLMARIGTDNYTEKRFYKFPQYSRDWDTDLTKSAVNGTFWKQYQIVNETNADLILTAKKNITSDISSFFTLGGNYRSSYDQYSTVSGVNLVIPDFYSTSNIEGTPNVSFTEYRKKSNSVFASANLGYKNFVFLDLTYRTDWSSTLPESNWQYHYPSVNLGFIFTDALNMESKILTYGKLRAGYAVVGSDTDPYQLTPTFGTGGTPFNGVTLYTQSATFPTSNLKPQKTRSFETGAELKFLSNRLGIDVTYYKSRTFNQILGVGVSAASGYSTWYKNAGEIENKGIEIQATAVPVKFKSFDWTVDLTWSKNQNTVVALEDNIKQLQITSLYYNSTLMAFPDKSWGTIYGTDYQKNEKGETLIGSNGLPITTTTSVELGNINPDWVGGIRNTFRYKNLSLSVFIDGRQGGDVISMTKAVGQYGGVTQNTVEGGIRENGMIVEGVYNAGVKINNVDVGGQPNATRISARTYFKATRPWGSLSVIDGSFIKLREVTLNYALKDIPLLKKCSIQKVMVGLFGTNLALLYKDKSNDVNIDPEVSTGGGISGVGLEAYQLPVARTMGLKVNVSF
jgi:TonB-linked SusC/RagA family outer membrane protein